MTNRPTFLHLRISDCYLKSMTDPCMYRSNIRLFAVYVYWTSFPLLVVSFVSFHFATVVLSLVDISFVVFGDCYRLHPKAYSSVYDFRFTYLLCFFWNERIVPENNSYLVWISLLSGRKIESWLLKTEICVLNSGYIFMYKTVGSLNKIQKRLSRILPTIKWRVKGRWVVKIAFKSFWRPCSTVMYLKRDLRAQTYCINCTEGVNC